ncbi:MAG: tetratricopeptide repeat protein [Flavobacteriaceae bacterium]|nr:MAG: tetratricopeptide repeat protein [Flavobacteriaceae bacterium]
MKNRDTNLIKKEIAIVVTIVALVIGFLGGVFYSALKSPSGTSQNAGTQSTGQPSQNVQQQANRILALEQEIAANPDNVNALIELGDIYLDSNRYENAISIFVKAEQLAPANFHILNDLGTLYLRTGRLETALEKFEAVLKIDPSHIHSLYYVGLVHRETGNADKALQAFEEVLGLNPDPQLADAIRQEIATLKDQPPPSGFPGSDFNQAK